MLEGMISESYDSFGGVPQMKVDLYTKSVLTIIAICLLWISLEHMFTPRTAMAAESPQKVIIVGWEGAEGQGIPVVLQGAAASAGPIKVNLAASSLPNGIAVPIDLTKSSLPNGIFVPVNVRAIPEGLPVNVVAPWSQVPGGRAVAVYNLGPR